MLWVLLITRKSILIHHFVVGMPGTPWKDYSFITAHIITG